MHAKIWELLIGLGELVNESYGFYPDYILLGLKNQIHILLTILDLDWIQILVQSIYKSAHKCRGKA